MVLGVSKKYLQLRTTYIAIYSYSLKMNINENQHEIMILENQLREVEFNLYSFHGDCRIFEVLCLSSNLNMQYSFL